MLIVAGGKNSREVFLGLQNANQEFGMIIAITTNHA